MSAHSFFTFYKFTEIFENSGTIVTTQSSCQFIFYNDVFIVLAFAKAEHITTLS
ncbi:hypothetical protein DDD_1839 [Nonlabens dokdonensis DSW-6]|uniref:Uncharacterized protein n=1 Tax=Nonlabens dokdonensis (strain DSM 17205 / KCTC 12402 / DSW-6) TaxID=592029 RepID=L7W5M5_NONDD|nr:hypothetical protein DDD_1839 [Nonlabens dokdonensis DSW-6]